jgi:hypothetical protein
MRLYHIKNLFRPYAFLLTGLAKQQSVPHIASDRLLCKRLLICPMRLMPNYIIIGAQRCGTTSLHNYLVEHPHIIPAVQKEVHFFDMKFHKGTLWYRAHFPAWLHKYYVKFSRQQALITGEGSPYYIFHPLVPGRIAKTLPQVKLIVLLRNPVDRAYSHYWLAVRRRKETCSFEEALKCEPERLQGEREKIINFETYHSHAYQLHSYLARGIYVDQLKVWRALFPSEQMLILCSEEFYADPPASMNRVFAFLGLPAWTLKDYNPYQAGDYPQMNPIIRKQLVDYFRPHNERLFNYLGLDFDWDR